MSDHYRLICTWLSVMFVRRKTADRQAHGVPHVAVNIYKRGFIDQLWPRITQHVAEREIFIQTKQNGNKKTQTLKSLTSPTFS